MAFSINVRVKFNTSQLHVKILLAYKELMAALPNARFLNEATPDNSVYVEYKHSDHSLKMGTYVYVDGLRLPRMNVYSGGVMAMVGNRSGMYGDVGNNISFTEFYLGKHKEGKHNVGDYEAILHEDGRIDMPDEYYQKMKEITGRPLTVQERFDKIRELQRQRQNQPDDIGIFVSSVIEKCTFDDVINTGYEEKLVKFLDINISDGHDPKIKASWIARQVRKNHKRVYEHVNDLFDVSKMF